MEENNVCLCPECHKGETVEKIMALHDAKASAYEMLLTIAAAVDEIKTKAENAVQQMLNEYTTPDNSVTHDMLKAHVVDVENLVDGCVTIGKISEVTIDLLVEKTKKRIEDEAHEEIYNTET